MRIAEPVCTDAGYELVELCYVSTPNGWMVQVFIDHPDGEGAIGFEDCERVSRELGAVLDVEDPLPHTYRLDVSSPGVDRPLRTAEHFRRHLQEQAKVTMAEGSTFRYGGRRNYKGKLVAVEGSESAAVVTIEVDGTGYQLPIGDIASAKLVPDWDTVFAKSGAGAQVGRQ